MYNSDKDGWEMSSEDLDAWTSTLQVCIARVLDGAGAVHVLDHLAGTIATTHIPTRAAELMLGHLKALARCGSLRMLSFDHGASPLQRNALAVRMVIKRLNLSLVCLFVDPPDERRTGK